MLKSFIKDSLIYTVPAFFSRGLSFILVPLYTRVLTPADYGSLDLLMVFAGFVNLTVALEVSQGVARFYAGESDPAKQVAYASTAFWFTVTCYSIFGLVCLFCSQNLAIWVMGQGGLGDCFEIGILYISLNGVYYLIQNQFRWELLSYRYAIVTLLTTLSTAVVAVWLAYVKSWGLYGLLCGMLAGVTVGMIYGLWHLRHSFQRRFNFTRLKEMLIFSTPLVPSGIAVFVNTYISRIMLNHYMSIDDVGLFGIGFRVAGMVGLVMVGFQGALTPLIYTHYRSADTPHQIARIFRVFIAIMQLIFLALTLFAHNILALMTTPDYYGAAVVVIYLVPAILLSQMYIFAPGIGIAQKTHVMIWINIGGAFLSIIFNYFFIQAIGLTGAGLAMLMSHLAIFSAYMIISQRLYHVPHDWPRLLITSLIAVMLAIVTPSLALQGATDLGIKTLALILMTVMIVAFGMVRPHEILQLKRIMTQQLRLASGYSKAQ